MWAVNEVRELDELCRSMVPGYAPLDSNDISKLEQLKALAAIFASEEEEDGSR